MKNKNKGEYLAPETEALRLEAEDCVLQFVSKNDIVDSTENPEIGW